MSGAGFAVKIIGAQRASTITRLDRDVLDRTVEIQTPNAEAEQPGAETPRAEQRRRALPRCASRCARLGRFFVAQSFSSLTRRIVILNLAGLVALVTGVLYLSQFRAGLIDARVQSLLVQSEIIAGAIAASATVDTDAITIDPDRLLELQAGPELRAAGGRAVRRRIPDQSRARGAGAAPSRLADQDARAHLRPRRRLDPRQPQSLRPRRRAALRPAAAQCRETRPDRARLHRACAAGSAAAISRSTRSSGRRTARAIRKSTRRSTGCTPAWCGSTAAARSSSRWRCRSSASARCAAR